MKGKIKSSSLQICMVLLLCAAFTAMPFKFVQVGASGFAIYYPLRAEASEGDYSLYTVQSGDTIFSIARKYGVEISQIRELNNLKDNLIISGQRLKIPTAASFVTPSKSVPSPPATAPSGNRRSGGDLFMNLRDADLRDVLSALALKMGTGIFLVEQPVRVTMEVSGVTPRAAFELLLQKVGLSYLQKDDMIIVGSTEKLRKDFFNQMVLTRFNLRHIVAGTLEPLISSLGIPVQTVRVEANTKTLWAQGTPQALGKLRELILAVDRTENVEPNLLVKPLQHRELLLQHITTDRAIELLADAGKEPQNYLSLGNRLLIFDAELINYWDEVKELFKVVDSASARDYLIFTYYLKNTYAEYIKNRIDKLNLGDITLVPLTEGGYGKFTRELLIVCPPQLESQVFAALSLLDTMRERIRVPIHSAKTMPSLVAKRLLLSNLTGVPADRMHISGNLADSPDETLFLLWVEETPDVVETLREMVKQIENP